MKLLNLKFNKSNKRRHWLISACFSDAYNWLLYVSLRTCKQLCPY